MAKQHAFLDKAPCFFGHTLTGKGANLAVASHQEIDIFNFYYENDILNRKLARINEDFNFLVSFIWMFREIFQPAIR